MTDETFNVFDDDEGDAAAERPADIAPRAPADAVAAAIALALGSAYPVDPGVSVAPFLSARGNPVLLLVRRGSLVGLLECCTVEGWALEQTEDGPVRPVRVTQGWHAAHHLRSSNPILREGVHAAAWHPCAYPGGGAWLVIDRDGQCVGIVEYAHSDGRRSAWLDASALLTAAQARYQPTQPIPPAPRPGWQDPYDDPWERGEGDDPSTDCGEGWKQP